MRKPLRKEGGAGAKAPAKTARPRAVASIPVRTMDERWLKTNVYLAFVAHELGRIATALEERVSCTVNGATPTTTEVRTTVDVQSDEEETFQTPPPLPQEETDKRQQLLFHDDNAVRSKRTVATPARRKPVNSEGSEQCEGSAEQGFGDVRRDVSLG